MPEIVQIGPLMLRFDWILLAISGFAGYMAIKRKWKQSNYRHIPLMDKLSNAVIIILLVWKISPVLFSPSIIWEYPFGLLTMAGSVKGIWLGGALAVLYLDSSLRDFKVRRFVVADLLSLGILVMISVYSILGWQYGNTTELPWGISIGNPDFSYHPVNLYTLLVSLPILIWLWQKYVLSAPEKLWFTFSHTRVSASCWFPCLNEKQFYLRDCRGSNSFISGWCYLVSFCL